VKRMIKHDASLINVRTPDEWSYTPMLWASQMGHTSIVQYLMEVGADFHAQGNKIKWKPILIACRYGHTDIVRLLLDAGEDVNIRLQHDNQFTPLHYAAQYGHPELARLLLERGASLTLVGGLGLRPIHTASNHGKTQVIDILLEHGEDVNVIHESDWRYAPLHWAVQENQLDTIEFLLQRGADVNMRTGKNLMTPLLQASRKGFHDAARLLLRYGADYRIVSPLGLRPIHTASCYGHTSTIKLLLEHGEDVNILHSSEWRYSSLHWAVQHGHLETCRFLLDNGCNMRVKTGKIPRSAMHLARKNNHPHIVELLKQFTIKEIEPMAKIMMTSVQSRKFIDIEIVCQSS